MTYRKVRRGTMVSVSSRVVNRTEVIEVEVESGIIDIEGKK